jgi:pimeloyl-ACP methyl ester carboxylesterase
MPLDPSALALFPGFEQQSIDVGNGVEIAATVGGAGPPLLLLHGHPQTRALWHRVAGQLAERYTLVAADLRGYGDSSKPKGAADHANYSKRVMAQDQVTLMHSLGFERFAVLAHDRGARVACRLAMDHPDRVGRLVILDIAPTLAMYEQTTEDFARAYWHWFFLIQPAPLPERLIQADPAAYICDVMGRRSAHSPSISAAWRWPEPRTACARTIAPPPVSIWRTTGKTATPAACCQCRCLRCGVNKASSTAVSDRWPSGVAWQAK